MNFFWQFRAARHISRVKSIEIDMDKMRMKFSALNVDFDGPASLDFLCSRKPAHEGIPKSRYFTVVGQSFVKTVANHHGHAAYHNKL